MTSSLESVQLIPTSVALSSPSTLFFIRKGNSNRMYRTALNLARPIARAQLARPAASVQPSSSAGLDHTPVIGDHGRGVSH